MLPSNSIGYLGKAIDVVSGVDYKKKGTCQEIAEVIGDILTIKGAGATLKTGKKMMEQGLKQVDKNNGALLLMGGAGIKAGAVLDAIDSTKDLVKKTYGN